MTVPVLRHNDSSVLAPPELGSWTPSLSVSVVIPAYGKQQTLDLVVAALAAQTYPVGLREVVIADDGSTTPITVPPLAPPDTRVVRVADVLGADAWGPGAARNAGAAVATGEVLVFLDADMLAFPHQLEAHLRWHHLCPYAVVLGHKHFIDTALVEQRAIGPEADQLIAAGRAADLFDGGEPHAWVEQFWKRTHDLTTAGPRAWRVHVGANFSVRRSLFESVGGMDAGMRLGEDIDLGWRLQEAGAVSIVDREARSWHLGPSRLMDEGRRVNEAQDPLLAHRTPGTRPKRQKRGRLYERPFVEVVLPDTTYADHPAIDAILDSSMHDLRVRLVCDEAELAATTRDERRHVLNDPHLDIRLLRQAYGLDPRVILTAHEAETDFAGQAPWRLVLPTRAEVPSYDALERLLDHAERTHLGLIVIELPDGSAARLERRAARNRAELVARSTGASVQALIEQTFGVQQLSAAEAGWVPVSEREPERFELRPKPAMSLEESMRVLRDGGTAGQSQMAPPATEPPEADGPEISKRRWLRGRS